MAAAGAVACEPEVAEREAAPAAARVVAAADPWFVERYGELAGEVAGLPRAGDSHQG